MLRRWRRCDALALRWRNVKGDILWSEKLAVKCNNLLICTGRPPCEAKRFLSSNVTERIPVPTATPVPPCLERYVRDCAYYNELDQPSNDPERRRLRRRHAFTGFQVAFLGTGSSAAVPNRGYAATVLRLGLPTTYLFDAGEGTLRQLVNSRIKHLFINKIFITHMHGDHVLGLPGLVLAMDQASKILDAKDVSPLEIFGPVGLYAFLISSLVPIGAKIIHRPVHVYELADTVNIIPRMRTIQTKPQSTVEFPGITRHTLTPNSDGTWTIPEHGQKRLEDSGTIRITAAEVVHVPGMPCFGYCVEEVEVPRTVDLPLAAALGVRSPEKLFLLKRGQGVMSDDDDKDGKRWVPPESVLGPSHGPRKFVLLGDTFAIPPVMTRLSRNADVLVHEVTLAEKDRDDAYIRGHSTPSMAGQFAQQVGAKVLVMSHFGPNNNSNMKSVYQIAKHQIKNGITQVLAAHDFMELAVPKGGFCIDHEEWRGEQYGSNRVDDPAAKREATTNSSKQSLTNHNDCSDNSARQQARRQSAQSWLTWVKSDAVNKN